MASETIGSVVLNQLIEQGTAFVTTVYSGLMGSWPGQTIVGLYVAFVGYSVLMGKAGGKSKEWAISALLVTVLSGVASNFGTFSAWIVDPVLDMMRGGASLAASGGTGTGGGTVSSMLDDAGGNIGKMMSVFDEMEIPGNVLTDTWLYFKVFCVVLVMTVLGCLSYLALSGLTCVAVFSVLMMLMVGGPCLFLASFPEFRHIFKAWIKSTMNYALWVFFLAGVGGIGNHFIGKVADYLTSWDIERDGVLTQAVGAQVFLCALSIYMLLKAADWAAAITGGTATQTGVFGALGNVAGGAVGGALSAAGGAAGSAARWAGGALVNKTAAGNAAYRAYSAIRGIGKVN